MRGSLQLFSEISLAHLLLLFHNITPQSMPDRRDGTAAAGTNKNERINKRGSVSIETVTPEVDSESKADTPFVAPSTTAKEPSPKKRRKVNHGQDDDPLVPNL